MGTMLEPVTADWKVLYRTGGTSALVMVAITLIQFVLFAIAPPPVDGRAGDWFDFFEKSSGLGLLGFEAALVVYSLLSIVVSVALCAALWRTSPSLMVLVLVLSVIAGLAFVVARPALEMLSLSDHYSSAATESERTALLAAGESMVALFHGTAFHVSYILGSITGLLTAVAMLRARTFGKAAPYLRIGSSVLDFGLFIPGIGLALSLLSVVLLLAFNLLVARTLLTLKGDRPIVP